MIGKVLLLIFAFTIMSVSGMAALNCSYDPNSYLVIGDDIKWSCYDYSIMNMKCYSMVLYGEDVISVYPDVKYVDGIGMVDYFKSDNGLVNVYFGTSDLHEGYNYTFEVMCGEVAGQRISVFNASISTVRHDLYEVGYRAIWAKENIPVFIGFGIVFAFAGMVLYYTTR